MSLDLLQVVLSFAGVGFSFAAGLALVEVRRLTLAGQIADRQVAELEAAYIARFGCKPTV